MEKCKENINMNQTINCNSKNVKECNEPEDFIKLIFPYCKTISERWAEKINELIDDDITVSFKTIKKGIITDIFEIADPNCVKQRVDLEFGTDLSPSEKTVYEQYSKNKSLSDFSVNNNVLDRIGNGSFSRNTINSWKDGITSPQNREDVIKLAFWAKYDIQETNRLLECAGMHKLYIKGTGNSKNTKSSLQDLVYMYMIQHKKYSFAEAQELISHLDKQLHEELGKTLARDGLGSSTKYLEDWLFHKSCGDIDDLKREFNNSFNYLIYDYRVLYGEISSELKKRYDVERNPEKYYGEDAEDDEGPSSIRELTTSKLNEFLKKSKKPIQVERKWKESLKNTLYAACNPEKPNMNFRVNNFSKKSGEKNMAEHQERCFQRNDIIVLGLILNKSYKGINDLLDMCKEQPLYGKNYTESIIINALERKRVKDVSYTDIVDDLYDADLIEYYKVTPDEVKSQLSIYDDIYIEYQNRSNYDKEQRTEAEEFYIYNAPAINAMVSLRTPLSS